MKRSVSICLKSLFEAIIILRRSIFIFSFGFLSIFSLANNPLATKEQVGMFKNSKTCVVIEGGMSFFNAPVKDAVQKYWKSTQYEFIDQGEFEIRKKNPGYSFILRMDGAYDKDPAGVSYSYISLVLGDPSGNLTMMPEFCSIPLSYSGDNDADYEYAMPAIIKFMQIHLRNLEKDRLPISLNGLRYYNKTGFKDKVLLFIEDKMAPNADSPDKIKKVSNNKVKLLDIDQMQQELNTNPSNSLFHFHVGPPNGGGAGKCFEMLFDIEGNLYYYNSRRITNDNADGFNLNDFNKIK